MPTDHPFSKTVWSHCKISEDVTPDISPAALYSLLVPKFGLTWKNQTSSHYSRKRINYKILLNFLRFFMNYAAYVD